jgi:hypothetical protein
MLVRTGFIDPKDYPFKKFIDEQKHLDTDELRHTIKSINHKVDEHFKGEEHLFCDKEQLNAEGKFRRPKKLIEAESRGFTSVADMMDADKKAEEDSKAKVVTDQKAELDDLKKQLSTLATSFQQYISAMHPKA